MFRKAAFSIDTPPHSFRTGAPVAEPEVEPETKATLHKAKAKTRRDEDIRLFLMSFTAFFLAISSFIW